MRGCGVYGVYGNGSIPSIPMEHYGTIWIFGDEHPAIRMLSWCVVTRVSSSGFDPWSVLLFWWSPKRWKEKAPWKLGGFIVLSFWDSSAEDSPLNRNYWVFTVSWNITILAPLPPEFICFGYEGFLWPGPMGMAIGWGTNWSEESNWVPNGLCRLCSVNCSQDRKLCSMPIPRLEKVSLSCTSSSYSSC